MRKNRTGKKKIFLFNILVPLHLRYNNGYEKMLDTHINNCAFFNQRFRYGSKVIAGTP